MEYILKVLVSLEFQKITKRIFCTISAIQENISVF